MLKGEHGPLRIISLISLLFLFSLTAFPESSAQSSVPEYSAEVQTGKVTVSVSLSLLQNFTLFKPEFTLPEFHGVLDQTNSSSFAAELQKAIQVKTPQAQAKTVRLEATSTAWSNQTRQQWFNISLVFSLERVSTVRGETAQFDLSWKSFVVGSNVAIGGFEVNKIGNAYLLGIAQELASEVSSTSPLIRTAFHVNGRSVASSNFAQAVSEISTLNFTSLAPQVSTWTSAATPFSEHVSWSLDPKRSFGTDFSVIVTEEPGELPVTTAYGVLYRVEATITAPPGSTAAGDIITVFLGETSEALMGVTIFSSVSMGLAAFLYERRLTIRRAGKPKRDKRQR